MTLYNLVHKFTTMPQAMNTPDAKSAVDTVWRKLETIHARNSEKVKIKKEVIPEAQRDKQIHFAPPMDIGHPEPEKYRSTKGESCSEGTV